MILKDLVRSNIWNLKPYSSARDEFQGSASIYFDANENPYNSPYNRYPDPLQWEVKKKIAEIKGVKKEQIMLGNGSDEIIDLLFRIFCDPGIDNVITLDPTYGMYKVAACTNHVETRQVLLDDQFDFEFETIRGIADEHSKIIILCSPNNPTGNSLNRKEIVRTIEQFPGIVAIDEAYIDFSAQPSFLKELNRYPNLIVMQTLSKAWGSAGVRMGMVYASEEIIYLFNKVKHPYNINYLTQEYVLKLMDKSSQVQEWIRILLKEREVLCRNLRRLSFAKTVYPSDANFLLVKMEDANAVYEYMVKRGVIMRNRNSVSLCRNCIRITVGEPEENKILLEELSAFPKHKEEINNT